MKRKLLLAALFVVSALGFNAKAQTWTAPAVPGTDLSELIGSSTNVGMYNVQADAFTTRAMTWSTQAAATKLHGSDNQTESYSNRHHVRVVAGNNSTVKFNFPCIDNTSKWLGDGAQGTERAVYTDNNSRNYEFIPTEVSGKDNVYTLKVATATSDENAFLDVWQPYGGQLTYANGQGFTEWAFIKFSDIENGKYKLYKAKKAMYEIYSAVVAAGLETNYSDALAAANTAYVAEDATFESVTAATNALIKAVSPALTKGYVNANALFTNPDMRGAGSKADWTDGYTGISWGVFENFHGYQGNKTLQQKQTELPNGFYKVVYHGIWRQDGSDAGPKLTLSSDNGSSSSADVPEIKTIDWGVGNTNNNNWTDANGKIVPNGMQSAGEGFSNGGAQVTIADFVVSDGTLTITVSTNSNSQWLIAQGFDIYYKAESLEEYANVFTSAKSEAEAIDQTKLNDYAKGVLVTALSNAATEQINKEWYQARTAELKNAVELAKAIVPVYPSAKELIALCEKYSANSTPNSEDIKNAFDGNIATAKTDVESAQTIEALTNAIAALESARQTYVQNAYPTNDVTFDLTFKIVNAQVTSKDGWTNGRIHSGEQYTGAPDNTYLDNWNALANNIKQEVVLPKGVYQLKAATRAGSNVTVGNIYLLDQATENNFSKDIHKVGNSGNVLGNGWDWTVVDNIILEGESNTVTVGFYSETSGGKWAGADNFTLTLVSKEPDFAYTLVTGKMESAVATAQTDAETAFTGNKTVANYNALIAAINNAQASVNAYAAANKYFAKMKAVLDNTNVYTQEAYNAKYGTWLAAYNENTLETAIAATLTENSAYSTGWHATNNIDDILLSTWTVGGEAAYEYDKALYINTWSIEGDSDGSNMSAPFFEYWIGDGEKLADNELVSTLPVEDGLYKFTALVRVVNKKTDEGNAGYDGISFQVNDGDVVPFTTGSEVIMDGKTVGIAATVEAQGLVKDGNLVIKAIVSGTNASWLSMKDFKYTKVRDLTEEEKAVVPTEITLDKTEVALNTETTTATLVPTFSPDNANTTVTWASSDATVATVDANGVVTALSSGTTTITVASTLNPEVKATATVTVTFPETSSSYVNEGPKRTITTVTGNNLIKNGSFEYPNGFYGWTNAADGALGSDKFDLVAEDGNVYLKAKTNEGAGGAGSIGTLWPIVAGKTYEFGYRVKGNPGNTDYQNLAMTNAPTSDEAKDGEIVSGTVTVANSWTYVKYEFTNTAEYAYLQFRARWLDSNQCFDDFYLVEKGGTTTTEEGNVEYATAAIPTANIGEGVFQYSQTAVDNANALVQGTATVEEVQNAYNALQVLNAPSADVAYKIYQKNGFTFGEETVVAGAPITFVEGGNAEDDGYYGLSWQYADNVNYAQALNFTNVEGNLYKISFVDVDGTTRYIATQKGAGYKEGTRTDRLRVTTDAEKALKVEVIPTTTDGLFNFKNTEHGSLIGGTDFGVFTTNSNAALAVKVAEEAVVTLNSDGGYYTLMLPFAAELPTGMKAYTCAEVDGNVLTLTEATSFAPNTPYIVVEGAGDYTFSGYGLATADSYTEGLLKGAYAQTDVPAGRYVLAVKPGETDAKFYVVGDAGAKLPAYRAYLTVANSEVKAFTIGRGDATGISAIEALQNGDAEIYTINGTRVNTLQKGINIVKMSNGKTQKVLVK